MLIVIPAKAGIQLPALSAESWTSTFVGVTNGEAAHSTCHMPAVWLSLLPNLKPRLTTRAKPANKFI
jgi:hypothetical protein